MRRNELYHILLTDSSVISHQSSGSPITVEMVCLWCIKMRFRRPIDLPLKIEVFLVDTINLSVDIFGNFSHEKLRGDSYLHLRITLA